MYTYAGLTVLLLLSSSSSAQPAEPTISAALSTAPTESAALSTVPTISAALSTATTESAAQPTAPTETTSLPPRTTPASNFVTILSNDNCSAAGAVNNILEIGCWGYKKCINGKVVTHWCAQGTDFERDRMTCVDRGTGNTDCDEEVSCQDKEDGMYADRGDHCETYYWCNGGVNLGHLYCPANLVFNDVIQSCDYPTNVEPPCGTKTL